MKNGKLRIALMIVLSLILLASVTLIIQRQVHLEREEAASKAALELIQSTAAPTPEPATEPGQELATAPVETAEPTPEPTPEPSPEPTPWVWKDAPVEDDENYARLQSIDLSALQAENPDVIGWLEIPDTGISYPLLQGEDNDTYLYHTWQKEFSYTGSIFLEQNCSPELDDFSIIIYGHNTRNGTMFGNLKKYKEQDYADEHPYIYIVDDNGVHRYEVFSSFEAPIRSLTYRLAITEVEDMEEFLADCISNSVIDTGVTPGITDRILTLSTCTGTGTYHSRWVVKAKISPETPNPDYEE